MSVVVFAYNFPHKKTQDFIQRLVLLGKTPQCVLAADPVKLNLPESKLRTKPRHADLVHPRKVCERFSIPYLVVPHGSDECVSHLREIHPSVGIVAGARILPRDVIDRFEIGIVNFHPGLIPEARGLDALQWSILHGNPFGVTAHLIDHKVDAGRIVVRREIPEYGDDSLIDLSLRIYETQVAMLDEVFEVLESTPVCSLQPVPKSKLNRSFPNEKLREMSDRFTQRLLGLQSSTSK